MGRRRETLEVKIEDLAKAIKGRKEMWSLERVARTKEREIRTVEARRDQMSRGKERKKQMRVDRRGKRVTGGRREEDDVRES